MTLSVCVCVCVCVCVICIYKLLKAQNFKKLKNLPPQILIV